MISTSKATVNHVYVKVKTVSYLTRHIMLKTGDIKERKQNINLSILHKLIKLTFLANE